MRRELKWGPFVLWHRLTRHHWFVPASDILPDYCIVCLKKAMR